MTVASPMAGPADDAASWRFRRSLARVGVVDEVVATYAGSYYGRPMRRDERPGVPPIVRWSVDRETVVEFRHDENGPDRLLVYELGLLEPLRKRLRTRHVRIEAAARGSGSDP